VGRLPHSRDDSTCEFFFVRDQVVNSVVTLLADPQSPLTHLLFSEAVRARQGALKKSQAPQAVAGLLLLNYRNEAVLSAGLVLLHDRPD
jgi:hypothetical protein